MNMHDPRLGSRMESAAMEARILSQNPRLRRRSPIRSLLVTLAILLVLIVVVIVWISSMALDETNNSGSGQNTHITR